MSLFHSKRVAVQRVYYKPSVMSRLKAAVTGRPQPRPRAANPAPCRMNQGGRTVVRQPVRKNGFFHRSPRRTVVASQRRPGFFGSMRPRQRTPKGAAVAGGRRHHGHDKNKNDKHHSHKGRNVLAILVLLGLKKKHDHKKHHKQPRRHDHHL
ncbi:hypothetical protein EMPS_02389 [Entomortierella parvispora]|uniref:Uncharacterized protein n=1 Tax=Entomortierella parvispora TaxID=205924 RepID=A0A9P3H4W3_9FUNG|nr:hypothetical protein EMPS_02389 [Entomortierella parvispora]